MKYWQDFSGKGRCWGLRKDIQKDLKCTFFIYYIVEVLARLFWERKLPGAQTPHLRRNHCRPLRKAQRPPGQVSEIKEQEEFQNIKKIANGTKRNIWYNFRSFSPAGAYNKCFIKLLNKLSNPGQQSIYLELFSDLSLFFCKIRPTILLVQGQDLAFLPKRPASKEGINWPMHILCFDLLPNGSLIILDISQAFSMIKEQSCWTKINLELLWPAYHVQKIKT